MHWVRLHDVAASVLVKADTDYTHVCAVFSFRSAYDLGRDDPRLYHLQNKVPYIDDGEMTLIVSFAKQSALYQRRGVEWIGGGGGGATFDYIICKTKCVISRAAAKPPQPSDPNCQAQSLPLHGPAED